MDVEAKSPKTTVAENQIINRPQLMELISKENR